GVKVPKLTDLTFEGVTDTTISLRWSPLDTTVVRGYKITVVAAGESIPIFEDMVTPTTGQYTVYGLEPGIDYDISVTTVTEHGESEPTTFTQQTCKISCLCIDFSDFSAYLTDFLSKSSVCYINYNFYHL
uniref:Fibronectin type-III domain-containing protein n=1 Tax=Xiphophorus couchianus TaxID=32473 RepID=A0A3B5MDA9_9TELE